VFIQSYFSGTRSTKSLEDDYNSPLIELNLISSISRENGLVTYKLNKENRIDFPLEIFGFCFHDLYGNNAAIQFKEIRKTLGSYFVLTNEGLEIIIEKLCSKYPEFIFNDDAGVRQIQLKTDSENYKSQLLLKYYEGV
jgi:hypothetical protein